MNARHNRKASPLRRSAPQADGKRPLQSLFDQALQQAAGGGRKLRILAFGSSNTERFLAGTHWFDCLELALRMRYGRAHLCCNAGVGGDTTRDLLRRIEADALAFHPDAAFVTIGGNDSNPDRGIGQQEFRDNLLELRSRLAETGCRVVFQTYYAPMLGELDEARRTAFDACMETVVAVASETNSVLVDHYRLWRPFALRNPEEHRKLMTDSFHVNALGNLALGLTIAEHLDVHLVSFDPATFTPAASFLERMKYSES
ncbi:MAG: SGNH/GDSL hydrolase family protein [Kiritimatiellia bacterium]|nr:SGNH/GDSL hydrolase family protein [Kiritimatiellia bacterium]